MKKLIIIIFMVFLLYFLFGCRDNQANAELDAMKAKAEVEEQHKELAKLYVETFNKKDFEAFLELLSPDYAIYSPSGYPEPTSREKLIENYKGALNVFSELTWSIEDLIASGDKVVIRFVVRGTYTGNIPDIPVAGKEVKFSMITIIRIENGKVVEEWQEDDQLGLVRQLGLELKPKEEK